MAPELPELPELARGMTSIASTVLFGGALAAVGVPACAEAPDWSQPDDPLVPLVPELPEVPVPMVPVLLELPLLPVGLPDASVALPEP